MKNKKKYKIIYRETLEHEFVFFAKSPEEAKAKFENEATQLDFSYGEIVDTSIRVEEDDSQLQIPKSLKCSCF